MRQPLQQQQQVRGPAPPLLAGLQAGAVAAAAAACAALRLPKRGLLLYRDMNQVYLSRRLKVATAVTAAAAVNLLSFSTAPDTDDYKRTNMEKKEKVRPRAI